MNHVALIPFVPVRSRGDHVHSDRCAEQGLWFVAFVIVIVGVFLVAMLKADRR